MTAIKPMRCKELLWVVFLASIGLPSALLADTTAVFRMDDYYAQIIKYHPVARQANLLDEKARQELRIARGMLDPTVISKFYRKELGGTNYYTLWDNTLKIPVWYGTDIKAGFERNSGVNVNGENLTPSEGLTYVGISVPIGQGLIIDERRSTIRQAQLMVNLAEAEKISMINKLLLQAGKDYIDWMFAYHRWQLFSQGYDLAKFRFEAVKERVVQGDLSGIDSVEAKIEMQNRRVMMRQAEVEYQNASLIVSNHLWTENNTPVEVTTGMIPAEPKAVTSNIQMDSLQTLLQLAQTNHPDLIKQRIKLNQLNIERRFIADKFKPKLNLEYNIIQKGFPLAGESFNGTYLSNNYKFGASFSFPIFLRNERGKLQLTTLKITESNLGLQQSGREIVNNVQAAYNDLVALNEQVSLQEDMTGNARIMRDGEQQLFNNGESSLFMINSREMSLINNQVKLYEFKAKYAKARITLQWAAGTMNVGNQ
ncbi:TolC family protein [Rhodocytophaga rosea]|uniref:TolC family protein n=1 Tax=Rhodocytophaga rosea TaxID=2704465 RepID=A0A6C0GNL1_9BACT|nr:TolC family protein [Rhodocytophaga rosea]QHT69434.1 TolC family protein [Rhodocytophaga rosea]